MDMTLFYIGLLLVVVLTVEFPSVLSDMLEKTKQPKAI
jgi:hypothetical protein